MLILILIIIIKIVLLILILILILIIIIIIIIIKILLLLILILIILIDDAFFNRDWAGACRGRWAGPGLLADWVAGSGCGTPLQNQERKRVGEGFARGCSDA